MAFDPTTELAIKKINEISDELQNELQAYDDLVNLMINCLIASESLVFFAPPGFGFSMFVKRFVDRFCLTDFHYTLFDATSAAELFDAFPLPAGQSSEENLLNRNLISADVAFLDEVFKCNSSVLNALIGVLSEHGLFYSGIKYLSRLRSVFFKSSACEVPALSKAFFDRIAVRYFVSPTHFKNVVMAELDEQMVFGPGMHRTSDRSSVSRVAINEVENVAALVRSVRFDKVRPQLVAFANEAFSQGDGFSLRKMRQISKLAAIATLRRSSLDCQPEDLWCLAYTGDRAEDKARISDLLNTATSGIGESASQRGSVGSSTDASGLKPVKIFVSHSHHDKAFAERLANDLWDCGVKVWFDKWEIRVGESIIARVQQGLDETDCLLLILSPMAVGSKWVERELNVATTRELAKNSVTVIPVLYRDCHIPSIITDKKYADFRRDYAAGFSELLDGLSVFRRNL